MSRLNISNYDFTALLMLILCFLVIFNEVNLNSNLFFISILIFSIFQKNFNYRFKKIFSSILSIGSIYILFVFNDYTLSKEYFINLILALVFLKYSEIEKKEHQYFFNFSCVFLAISSLIYGQDLLSSVLSFGIVIISIIHLYTLNQIKILKLNLKNLIRYLVFALSIIPVIAIVYFAFPRTELNIKLFETKKNQLGIPDKISLGSFQDISDSDETVFIYVNSNENDKKNFYFRVKVFDQLNDNKDWISTGYKIMLYKFKNDFKVIKDGNKKQITANIIMFPHEKNWIPKLNNYNYVNKELNLNLIDNTITSNKILSNKKSFKLIHDKRYIEYEKEFINYYTLVPKSISPKLKNWSEKNYLNSKDDKEYLEKILNQFRDNNFFYSLTPSVDGNNYENFFFNSKTGYCEYFAGTFALLARLVGIPARIVTGYYGGSYNNLGKFYTFKQQDAHSWVEIYIENKWVRYDPTLSVPEENILQSNNTNLESNNSLNNNSFETSEEKINKIGIYFDYVNYIWTNSFLRYDEKSREKFIKNQLTNIENFKIILLIIFLLIILFCIFKFSFFVYNKHILFPLFFEKIKKQNFEIKNHMTHQEIYKMLGNNDQKVFLNLFDYYEKIKFDKNIKISLKNFYDINLKILSYVYFSKKNKS